MNTYEEIATAVGLKGEVFENYIHYMRERWADTEKQKCNDGYAREWANRFRDSVEHLMSDSVGQAILEKRWSELNPREKE